MRPLKASSGRAACRSGSMTLQQQATLRLQQAEGFKVVREENNVVLISRGNDYRVIWTNGTVHRGQGARK